MLSTEKNPQLFALVVEHLSGYKVVPLSERAIPQNMGLELAHSDLLANAEYFQLDQLGDKLSQSSSTLATHSGVSPSLPPILQEHIN